MAKLLISASDLREIIERDPEIHAELIRSATEQVAETIARRITNEQVATHVEHCMRSLVEERTGYGERKLAAPFVRLIEDAARQAVNDRLDAFTKGMFTHMFRNEIDRQLPRIAQQLSDQVGDKLNELIKDQLVQLLLKS